MRHDEGDIDAVLTGVLIDPLHPTHIALTAIATVDLVAVVHTVFIPREEVHTDEVHAHISVVLEEGLEVLLSSRVIGEHPTELIILRGVEDILILLGIVAQATDGDAVSTWDDRIGIAIVQPEGIVVDPELEPLSLELGDDRRELDLGRALILLRAAVARHVSVVPTHSSEAIGDEHIVAVGLELGSDEVDSFIPVLLGEDIGERAILLLLTQCAIDAPVERSIVHTRVLSQWRQALRRVDLVDAEVTRHVPRVAIAAGHESCQRQCGDEIFLHIPIVLLESSAMHRYT